jgi:NADPH:quinone reductase-like Zn-dependent oxidoreductase
MADPVPATALQMRSLVTPDQTVELSLASVEVPTPGPTEVLIRVEAAPINPSDLGILLARADVLGATVAGSPDSPVVTMPLPDGVIRLMAARVGISMPVGNEGAGTVVAAGSAPAAQALLGKTVAAASGGGMYAQYRCVDAMFCLELPAGTTAVDGASSFVNPMTALSMVETMRRENHVALVHTAAASNLGQMLNRLCISEQIPLVNVVRRPEHQDLLRSAGAAYVCNSAAPHFAGDLTAALKETSATLAFDAIGGGRLASQILACMEAAASTGGGGTYSQYGSAVHKQVYIYGGLDPGPTELTRNFGFGWGVGGWLLTTFLGQIGLAGIARLRSRVAAELTTTFASSYTGEVSLAGALTLDALTAYARQATGQKYLIRPDL